MKRKDAILTKCFHAFCYDCLRTRYETRWKIKEQTKVTESDQFVSWNWAQSNCRQRKCPKCNAAFGASDYHRCLFIFIHFLSLQPQTSEICICIFLFCPKIIDWISFLLRLYLSWVTSTTQEPVLKDFSLAVWRLWMFMGNPKTRSVFTTLSRLW